MGDAVPMPAGHMTRFGAVASDQLGWLSTAQMVEVDRVMMDDLHIELVQMMENAGRNLARLVLDLYAPSTTVVNAGSGGNGGGGLVAARHLANAGVDVALLLGRPPEDFRGVPGHQLDIVRRMGVPILETSRRADVTVDALVGYSLRGAPRGRTAELIRRIDEDTQVVVSLDTPSGVDLTTGERPGAVVRAGATLTLAAPKLGLRGLAEAGDLYVADISVPPSVLRGLGLVPPDFRESSILRVLDDALGT